MPHDVLVEPGTTSPDSPHESSTLPRQQENRIAVAVDLAATGPYSALPPRVLFGALRHPALKLRRPIPLRTERSEQGISVVWDEGQEFGFGDTFTNAIADFGETITELHFYLANVEALSEDLTAVRDRLSHYIDVRPR